MGKARWRALVLLLTVTAIILAMSFAASGQGDCVCDYRSCNYGCFFEPKFTSFRIPLGTIAEALATLAGAEIPPGLSVFIPDIGITLDRGVTGKPKVSCLPAPCCDSGVLSADVWLYMEGTAELGTYPATVSGALSVKEVQDNGNGDEASEVLCLIYTTFWFKQGGVSISLVFLEGVGIPLLRSGSARGGVKFDYKIYCGCSHGAEPPQMNRQPTLMLPTQVVMSTFEREVSFPFEAWDPDGDPLWIGGQVEGVSGEVGFDLASRRGTIMIPADVTEGTSAKVFVELYDLKQGVTVVGSPRDGEFYHSVIGTIELRFISNHRPEACDIEATIYRDQQSPVVLSCDIIDPDGDDVWGPRWLGPPPAPDTFGCYQPFGPLAPGGKGTLVLWCYPERMEMGQHEIAYAVWDNPTGYRARIPSLTSNPGHVRISVENESPIVSR